MNFLSKIIFYFKKPKIVIVTGNSYSCTTEAIFQVLRQYKKARKIINGNLPLNVDKNDVLIFETDFNVSNFRNFEFLAKKSSLPILVITHIGNIPFDKDFFAGDREKTFLIREMAKALPVQGHLILNFDDETVREIKDEINLKELTFGLQERADFRATDFALFSEKAGPGTNFKVNYKGSIVPIWLEKLFGKEQIYSALAAAAVGTIFNLNLVEISQALKNYYSLPGRMRLIKGIDNYWILDDSDSATVFSMVEAIEILGRIQGFKRKVAVLGDVIGIGKYTIEAHEAIGEKVARNADLLFTFGPRAKFIAQGALQKGMNIEKIFQFDTIDEGKLKLQDKIEAGDLILVDGSKEMEMKKIVEEIKG